jgi:DNA polymerase kappa
MDDPVPEIGTTNEGIKHAHLFLFSGGNKAGMEKIDKEKQAEIIYQMSKNSLFYKRQVEQDNKVNQKVSVMKTKLSSLIPSQKLTYAKMHMDRIAEVEKLRRFDRICCVLDMDMFFAAVEIRDQPHLKDLPVAVGGIGMISTANYVARKYGVRSAMPGFIAKKLCPELIFVKSHFGKYTIVSEQIRSIIKEYDPYFTSHSLDEVYMDLTAAAIKRVENLNSYDSGVSVPSSSSSSSSSNATTLDDSLQPYGDDTNDGNNLDDSDANNNTVGTTSTAIKISPPVKTPSNTSKTTIPIFTLRKAACEILQEIRKRVKETTGGLTCSAGIANNFFLAKIGADVNKPDGQFELQVLYIYTYIYIYV